MTLRVESQTIKLTEVENIAVASRNQMDKDSRYGGLNVKASAFGDVLHCGKYIVNSQGRYVFVA